LTRTGIHFAGKRLSSAGQLPKGSGSFTEVSFADWFVFLFNESVFLNCAAMFVRRIAHCEFCCNENDIRRPLRGEINPSRRFKRSAFYDARNETLDRIVSTWSRRHGKTPVAELEKRLHSILSTLETCRAGLVESDSRETAHLVSIAILELRMKLNQIAEAELKALCEAMLPADARTASAQDRESQYVPRQRPLLKLVK